MALLDALRALTSFDPPPELPPCDLEELAELLDAHGLAPLASYQLESRRLGAGVPMALRERLLPLYQGAVNDNVFKLMTLKGILRQVDVPTVVLGAASYLDWIYPHLAFRPVGELTLAVRGADGARFAAALAEVGFTAVGTGSGGHTATFDDGRLPLHIQEGLLAGRGEEHGLFDDTVPLPALGTLAVRAAAGSAILHAVGELARAGLYASLLAYLDLRELLLLPELAEAGSLASVRDRARAAGLDRALYGACALVAHYFPQAMERASALSPELGRAERAAVQAIVESAGDPAKLRVARGAEAAARLLLSP
ncbi:MAG TPA: nucleotidyltransferase family protein [Anaeromyxobacteraceae bacterium]